MSITLKSKAYPQHCSGCGKKFKYGRADEGDSRYGITQCSECSTQTISQLAIKLGKSGDEINTPKLSDTGNAIYFAKHWMHDVVYVQEARSWFVWNGKVWEHDPEGIQMMLLAKITVDHMYRKAATIKDEKAREGALQWCKQSESVVRQKAMIESAKSLMKVMHYTDFDQHHDLLVANNCTIDLRTGKARPHDRTDYMTKITPVDYKPEESSPKARWYKFLDEIQPGHNACCVPFFQRMAGYMLTGETREECFFVFYGALGRNGKGTFVETITHVMGDWVGDASFDTFVAKKGDEKLNDIAGFRGRRLIVASESEASKRLAESKLKRMTGGDRVVGEFKYQEQFAYRPTYKIALITNYKPKVVGQDNGIWDRLHLIDFPAYFGDDQKDVNLKDTLRGETEEILRWMVRGAVEWYKHGLQVPKCIKDNTESYRNDQNVLGQFLEERCAQSPELTVSKRDLYDDYHLWAERSGEYVMGKVEFWERMSVMFEEGRSKAMRYFKGVGLKSSSMDSDTQDALAKAAFGDD